MKRKGLLGTASGLTDTQTRGTLGPELMNHIGIVLLLLLTIPSQAAIAGQILTTDTNPQDHCVQVYKTLLG